MSIAELIGLTRISDDSTNQFSLDSLESISLVDPDDYPGLAPFAKNLKSDLRTAYAEALAEKEAEERIEDHYFLNKAKEYVELNEQVETSAALLTDLASFLSNFQRDLSAVSGHISELQGRSKTIEGRLESRRSIERSLHPLLASILITPTLINVIMDTEVTEAWIPAIIEFDAKLGAIRSGPRVESRRILDQVAEALRIRASQKILNYLLAALKPYSLSVTASLIFLQSTILLPVKPLFDFLRRHSARQAHEFQKAYTSTIRWFYETGFRRYVRALETIRLRSVERLEDLGVVTSGSEASLALLARKNESNKSPATYSTEYSHIQGPAVIAATMANGKEKPPPESLFHSISLVLMDNAEAEYAFLTTFFGHHSDLPVLPARSAPPSPFGPTAAHGLRSPSINPSSPTNGRNARRESIIDLNRFEERAESNDEISENGSAQSQGERSFIDREVRGEKLRKAVVDALWKSIMEPAQEYSRNFINAIIDPTRCSPTSLLSMIRLNDSIFTSLIDTTHCPPMENHLIGIRLSLWPLFQKTMGAQVESLRRINGTAASGGVFTKTSVKDSAVQIIALRYVALFNSIIALSSDSDEEDIVFTSLLRVRSELSTLFKHQASKISDPAKGKAFLSTHYQELLDGLSVGKSSHVRRQREIAHWRELAS